MSIRRIARAISWFSLFAALFAVFGYIKSSAGVPAATNNATPLILLSPFFLLVLAAFAVAGFQTWVNYSKDWYSPDLALKFQSVWESENARQMRSEAASAFKQGGKWTNEVEPVLDIIEDIGFYVEHDEISPEVAHHHFYHWVRGYIQTASEYVKDLQKTKPTEYDHCEALLISLSKVEAKRIKKTVSETRWEQKEINQFIQDEIDEITKSE